MGWQGTLVLTLWLPKVLGLVTRKVLFFFFSTFAQLFPPLRLLSCEEEQLRAGRVLFFLYLLWKLSLAAQLSPFGVRVSHGRLGSLNQSYRVTPARPCPSTPPPPTRALADGELSRATRCIALCQVLVSHTDSLILYLYTWWECTCTSLCAYNWWACLPDQTLPALLSTSAGHVERGKHTNTPVGENKGAVLVCLLDIERSLGML